MNFSLLRKVYIDWHLRILGYEDPCPENNIPLPEPRPRPRVVTCGQVLQRLRGLPGLRHLQALQARQQKHRPKGGTERTLKLFCRCAGTPLIQAYDILANLRCALESLDPTASATPFTMYRYLTDSLVEARRSHAVWEVSIGDDAFSKKHPETRSVRLDYLGYMLQLLYAVADLTFPEDRREYLLEMGDIVKQDAWRDELILDSPVTYERSRRKTRPEVIAPVNQYPKNYLLYGQTSLSPFLVHNNGVYGHRLVGNECAIRRIKDARKTHLNLGRFNNWDQQW